MGPPEARRSLAAACRAGQAGSVLTRVTLLGSTLVVLAFWGFAWFRAAVGSSVSEPITLTGDSNDLGVMKEPVQDRRGRWNVTEQFAPVLQRSVGRHDRRPRLIPAHDDFKQVLAGTFGQLLDAHIIDNQKIGLEIFGHDVLLAGERFIMQEVSDRIEDGAISNCKIALDGLVSNRLDQVTFAGPGRP